MEKIKPEVFSIEEISKTHNLGVFELRREFEHIQKVERLEAIRTHFNPIRSVFLKFLPYVDTEAFYRLFSQNQRNMIEMGNSPTGWSIHHQKPLHWCGKNFNPAFQSLIFQMKLTPFQEKKCKKFKNQKAARQAFQLENYLKEAQKNNRLKQTFLDLFKGYLILLPEKTHQALEQNFLQPQTTKIQSDKTDMLYQIAYPVWKQVILGGRSFERKKSPRTFTTHKSKTVRQIKNQERV